MTIGKFANTQTLSNTNLNDVQIKKKSLNRIKMKIQSIKIYETQQNGAEREIYSSKCLYFQKLDFFKKAFRKGIIKITAEISEIEIEKQRKLHKMCLFEHINNLDKVSARLTKKKKRGHRLPISRTKQWISLHSPQT